MGKKVVLEIASDLDVSKMIEDRVTRVVQAEVDKCSKEYFRTINVELRVEAR